MLWQAADEQPGWGQQHALRSCHSSHMPCEQQFDECVHAAVVPPKGWTPRKQGYDSGSMRDVQLPHPIKQIATGSRGLYRLLLVSGKPQSLLQVPPLAARSWQHASGRSAGASANYSVLTMRSVTSRMGSAEPIE